jgi:hypothetical protein
VDIKLEKLETACGFAKMLYLLIIKIEAKLL